MLASDSSPTRSRGPPAGRWSKSPIPPAPADGNARHRDDGGRTPPPLPPAGPSVAAPSGGGLPLEERAVPPAANAGVGAADCCQHQPRRDPALEGRGVGG